MKTSSWFSTGDEPALRDLWGVFDVHFDAVLGALVEVAPDRETIHAGARERIQRALAGGWDEYETYLRAEAAGYARRGLSFATWQGLVAAMYTRLTPFVVATFTGDPPRLTAVLVIMHRFASHALAVLGEAYLGERDTIGQARELETERARRQAERRFGRLVESGIVGVVVGTLDGRTLAVNDAAVAIIGRTREEMLSGRSGAREMTAPEWEEGDAGAALALRRTGVCPLREKEYVHEDGQRVPVLIGSAVVEGAEGEVISFILDRTETKRAEAAVRHLEAIRAGEELFRALVDSVTDYAIFMLHPDGRIATWNRGAERLKGYSAAEIIGQDFSIFYAPEDRASGTPAAELTTAIREGRSQTEGWHVRRDGSRFWADVVINATKDETGNVLGFAKVTRDLTAPRAAAQALRDANQELEAFSYSVAHDLRAPLRGMSGFAQLLHDHYGPTLDADGKDWLEEILLNAKKMGALIDALLSLGRVTRSTMKVGRIDLSGLANDAFSRLTASEPARAVRCVVEPGLVVDADGNLVRALLGNLIENAWKFSARTPSACIEVGAAEIVGERSFFVRDNGAGFDMAFADKLFAPFQRLHTVSEFPGTGIGLATAQRIVRRHRGRIWAEGAVGAGATFRFTLPGSAMGDRP